MDKHYKQLKKTGKFDDFMNFYEWIKVNLQYLKTLTSLCLSIIRIKG